LGVRGDFRPSACVSGGASGSRVGLVFVLFYLYIPFVLSAIPQTRDLAGNVMPEVAAGKMESILDEPEPFVLQNGLGDFAVQYKLVAFTEDAKTAVRTVSELRQHALDEFNDAGVEIMTPMIHAVRNSADLTTPTSAAQPDSPPTFQVHPS
jgi:small-conductance mechanosensitive channel